MHKKKKNFFNNFLFTNSYTNCIYISQNFLFNFRQYFRFFVFFKYVLRFTNKKSTKGWLSYFFLVPKVKKSRNARMGKGLSPCKGFLWQGIGVTSFLYFLNINYYFYYYFIFKIQNKLPFKIFFTSKSTFLFNKKIYYPFKKNVN